MLRLFAAGVVLAVLGTLVAAPVPADMRKPAAFPAGHYVLAGAGEAAQGSDVYEFTKTFRLKPNQYVLSGGAKPTDLIVADDDLEVYQEKKALFLDDDRIASTEIRGKRAASYQGRPILLVLDPAKKLRVRVIDYNAPQAIIGQLWLHRYDGARKKLTDGKSVASALTLPDVFFDESFALGDGCEMPEKVSTDAAIDVPAKPHPCSRDSKPPPRRRRPRPFSRCAPAEGARHIGVPDAITSGLEEDGVTLTLASSWRNATASSASAVSAARARRRSPNTAAAGSSRRRPRAGLPEEPEATGPTRRRCSGSCATSRATRRTGIRESN